MLESVQPDIRLRKRDRVVVEKTVDDEQLEDLLAAREHPLVEHEVEPGVFDVEEGPFDHYRRTIVASATGQPGMHHVRQVTTFKLAIPIWGWMFRPLVRQAIRKPPPPGKNLWWLPPDNLDARASRSLSLLAAFSALAGYLGVLLSQTNTYFRSEFGASTDDVANLLVAARLAALAAFVLLFLADKRGRKRMLLVASYLGILLAATGAFAPSLFALAVSQTLARSCSAAIGLLVAIMAAEEMPRNSRAFGVSMLVMSAALGAGGVVMFLKLADLNAAAWRIFFLAPLLMLLPVRRLARSLHETRRFEMHEAIEELAEDGQADAPMAGASHTRRFVLLASTAFLVNIFVAPAGSYFNDFLRTEQGYDGLKITGLQVITSLPGGIAIIIGGWLADRFGRRIIGAIGMAAGTGFEVLMFVSSGWSIWIYSTLSTLIGAIAVPALGVYGPELFSTGSRGKAGGGLNLLGVAGAVIGLKAAAMMQVSFGSYSTPMAILGIAPAIVVIVIIVFYPETAHRTLEELNPEDAPPPPSLEDLAELEASLDELHSHETAHEAEEHLREIVHPHDH